LLPGLHTRNPNTGSGVGVRRSLIRASIIASHFAARSTQWCLRLHNATRPVIWCDEWTPTQVKAFRLLVNRSASWADWDEELLTLELLDLKAADIELAITGFDPAELDDLLFRPESEEVGVGVIPEIPTQAVTRPGDLWVCGEHRILCGDATGAQDVSRVIGSLIPVLMVTDPPYGVNYGPLWRQRAGLGGATADRPSR
jgi:hypothetical protein